MKEHKEYKVEVKVKNNYLLKTMQQFGIVSIRDLSEKVNITLGTCYGYLNLNVTPFNKKDAALTISAKRLTAYFGCGIEDLFPERHLEESLQTNKASFEANLQELQQFTTLQLQAPASEPLAMLEDFERREVIGEMLQGLTRREMKVLKLSFGFTPNEKEYTADEIGEMVGVPHHRIRQIKEKALRKLRHPECSDILRPFITEEGMT